MIYDSNKPGHYHLTIGITIDEGRARAWSLKKGEAKGKGKCPTELNHPALKQKMKKILSEGPGRSSPASKAHGEIRGIRLRVQPFWF